MDWLASKFTDIVQQFVNTVLNDLINLATSLISSLLVNPSNMNSLPGFSTLLTYIQGISSAALVFVFVKEVFMNQLEDLGDAAVSPLVMIRNTVIAGCLIWVSPLLVMDIMMPMVIQLTNLVSGTIGGSLDVNISKSLSLGTISTAGMLEGGFLAGLDSSFGFWAMVVVMVVIVGTFVIMAIQSGMRWAELYFLALMGPVLAVTRASITNLWGKWLFETISTAFSQLIQYFAAILAIDIITHPNSIRYANGGQVSSAIEVAMIVGILVFGIMGPRTLRSIVSSGNPGGLRASFDGAFSSWRWNGWMKKGFTESPSISIPYSV